MVYLHDPIAPKTCTDCPFWEKSDRTPNTGNCPLHCITTGGHEPTSDDCIAAFWAVAEANLPLHQVDRALPVDPRSGGELHCWNEGRLFKFIRSDKTVFDVSIQRPYGRFLGQIELVAAGWKIIRTSDRQPHTSHTVYATYLDAAEALLKPSRNAIDRAGGGRLSQFVAIGLLAAIGFLSFAPNALAYRGSGRDLPTDPQQSQPYTPPDRGAPAGTIGSGTR